jgi:hypothetical protein
VKGNRYERGSITIWLLGLGISLLVLGGLGLDLWTAVIVHARLSGLAEAVATAAASGISEDHWRRTGQIRIDPERADLLGRSLASRHPDAAVLAGLPLIAVDDDLESVTVQVRGSARLTLLRLVSSSDRIGVVVSATSRPHVIK